LLCNGGRASISLLAGVMTASAGILIPAGTLTSAARRTQPDTLAMARSRHPVGATVDGVLTSDVVIDTVGSYGAPLIVRARIILHLQRLGVEIAATRALTAFTRTRASGRVSAHKGGSVDRRVLGTGAEVAVLRLRLVVDADAGWCLAARLHASGKRRIAIGDLLEICSAMTLSA
jgi:hypothetical protein